MNYAQNLLSNMYQIIPIKERPVLRGKVKKIIDVTIIKKRISPTNILLTKPIKAYHTDARLTFNKKCPFMKGDVIVCMPKNFTISIRFIVMDRVGDSFTISTQLPLGKRINFIEKGLEFTATGSNLFIE